MPVNLDHKLKIKIIKLLMILIKIKKLTEIKPIE